MFKVISNVSLQTPQSVDVNQLILSLDSHLKTLSDPSSVSDSKKIDEISKALSDLTRLKLRPGLHKWIHPLSGEELRLYTVNPDEKLLGGMYGGEKPIMGPYEACCFAFCFCCCHSRKKITPQSMQQPERVTPLQNDIRKACLDNNIDRMRELCGQRTAQSVVTQHIGVNGHTALHMAQSAEMVRFLCDRGADVNVRNFKGQTPMHTAASGDVVRQLVAHGGDVNARLLIADHYSGRFGGFQGMYTKGDTPLHHAMSSDVIIALLENNANYRLTNEVCASIKSFSTTVGMMTVPMNPPIPASTPLHTLLTTVFVLENIENMKVGLLAIFGRLNETEQLAFREFCGKQLFSYVITLGQFSDGVAPLWAKSVAEGSTAMAGSVFKPDLETPLHDDKKIVALLQFLKEDLGVLFPAFHILEEKFLLGYRLRLEDHDYSKHTDAYRALQTLCQ